MPLRRLAIIGAGGIAELALSTLADGLAAPLEQVSMLVPEQFSARAEALLERLGSRLAKVRKTQASIADVLADNPDIVAECASHNAVQSFGPAVLEAGRDLIVISIGSLADDELRRTLEQAARKGGGRILLPSGAIGGIDALSAARLSGLDEVIYTGRKPPNAWRNTAAEKTIDLASLTAPMVFFEGNARTAATEYPFNANVAATLAIAGIGFEKTKVRLIADPSIKTNVHEFAVRSGCGDFTVKLEGRPSASNPKTSQMAGYSVARELLNRAGTIVI